MSNISLNCIQTENTRDKILNIFKSNKKYKKKYKSILYIENNSLESYYEWSIYVILKPGSFIENCENFNIRSNFNRTNFVLTPGPKIQSILNSGDKISTVLECVGDVIKEFIFNGTTKPIYNYIYNLPLTNLSNINELLDFKYHYSYDKQKKSLPSYPNPLYFTINQPNGLEMNIYKDDLSFQKESHTFARTEIKGIAKILDNYKYTLTFDQFIYIYPGIDYQYCWIQVFGATGDNIMVRFRNGKFQLLVSMGKNDNLDLPGNPLDDVGKWINWKVEFLLSNSDGYVKIYRNNIFLGQTTGNTSGENNSYLIHGIYSQQMDPIGTMTTYTKNLQLYY